MENLLSKEAQKEAEAKDDVSLWLREAKAMAASRDKQYNNTGPKSSSLRKERRQTWELNQGRLLEPALASGAIALLDSLWLAELAEKANVKAASSDDEKEEPIQIHRRQDLPPEAFLTLDQVIACARGGQLQILMVSHMWLQPDHPDPKGTTLRKVVEWCKAKAQEKNVFPRWAVFWDYASLHQHPRTLEETNRFGQGLDSLATFFSHPQTYCLQVKEFPPGYPEDYCLPEGANVAEYSKRGWPLLESCLIRLKNRDKNEEPTGPPLLPETIEQKLGQASFTNAKEDRPLVLRLYTDYFVPYFTGVEKVLYSDCGWGNEELCYFAAVVEQGYAPNLRHIHLGRNSFDHSGFTVLIRSLSNENVLSTTKLDVLNVGQTPIGDSGVKQLCCNTRLVGRLRQLWLQDTNIGDHACLALWDALGSVENPLLEELFIWNNDDISKDGCKHLCQIVNHCQKLRRMMVPKHLKGTMGGQMLEAIAKKSSSMRSFRFA